MIRYYVCMFHNYIIRYSVCMLHDNCMNRYSMYVTWQLYEHIPCMYVTWQLYDQISCMYVTTVWTDTLYVCYNCMNKHYMYVTWQLYEQIFYVCYMTTVWLIRYPVCILLDNCMITYSVCSYAMIRYSVCMLLYDQIICM